MIMAKIPVANTIQIHLSNQLRRMRTFEKVSCLNLSELLDDAPTASRNAKANATNLINPIISISLDVLAHVILRA